MANGDNEQMTVGVGKWGFSLRGTSTIIIVTLLSALAIIVFYVWSGFADARLEHRNMTDEMRIQSYILAECLKGPKSCPDLLPPPGLAGRLYPKH